MKVILVLSAVLVAVFAAPPVAAPQPNAPLRPSGRLILLPAEAASATSTTPAPRRDSDNPKTDKPDDAKSEKFVDAGEYYVLTPEGKLQMVRYTTAALKAPAPVMAQPEPFAQFQIEYLQYPGFEVSQPQPAQVKTEEKSEETSGFETKLQFRDVKPIPAPIYTYNPAPAVRILRK